MESEGLLLCSQELDAISSSAEPHKFNPRPFTLFKIMAILILSSPLRIPWSVVFLDLIIIIIPAGVQRQFIYLAEQIKTRNTFF